MKEVVDVVLLLVLTITAIILWRISGLIVFVFDAALEFLPLLLLLLMLLLLLVGMEFGVIIVVVVVVVVMVMIVVAVMVGVVNVIGVIASEIRCKMELLLFEVVNPQVLPQSSKISVSFVPECLTACLLKSNKGLGAAFAISIAAAAATAVVLDVFSDLFLRGLLLLFLREIGVRDLGEVPLVDTAVPRRVRPLVHLELSRTNAFF